MKKIYTKPEIEFIYLRNKDIFVSSKNPRLGEENRQNDTDFSVRDSKTNRKSEEKN